MSEIVLGIRLTADGKDLVGVVRVSAEEIDKLGGATKRASSESEKLNATQKNLGESLNLSASAIGMYSAAWNKAVDLIMQAADAVRNYIKDAALLNARHETMGVVLEVVGRNAGYSGREMDMYAESVRKSGITMIESRESIAKMVQANLNLVDASKLARVAQDAAVIGNINSSEAFARLIYGIQSGQPEILRTIGINVNFEASYKKLAAQLGVSTEQLTQAEKTQARMNVALESGTTIAGTYEAAMGTAGKMMNSLARYTEDLKVMRGEIFNEALVIAVNTYTDALKGASDETAKLARDNKLKEWGRDLIDVFAFLVDQLRLFKVITVEIATPIERLARNIYTLGAAGSIAFGPGTIAEKKAAMDQLSQESQAYYKALDDRLKANRAFRSAVSEANEFFRKKDAESAERAMQRREDDRDLALARSLGLRTGPKPEARPTGKDTAEQVSEYSKLAFVLQQKLDIDKQSTEVEKLQFALDTMLLSKRKEITAAEEAGLFVMAKSLDTRNQETAALKNYADNEEAMQKLRQEGAKASALAANKIGEAILATDKNIEQMKFETTLIGLSSAAREEAIALRAMETAGIDKESGAYKQLAERIKDAYSSKGAAQAAQDGAKKVEETFNRVDDNIGRGLTDSLMRGFDNAKPFAESFRDGLVNMFKTMVLTPVIRYILSPVTGAVTSAMVGAGLSGTAAAAGTGTSPAGVGGWLSAGSGTYNAYNAGSNSGLMSSAAGYSSTGYVYFANSSLGQSLGLSAATAPGYAAPITTISPLTGETIATQAGSGTAAGGMTAQGTATGSYIGTGLATIGGGLAGYAIGSSIAGNKEVAGMSGSTTSALGAVGGGIYAGAQYGSAAGPWGALIGGIVGGIVAAAFGSGPKQQSADTSLRGQFQSQGFSGGYATPWKQEGGWLSSDKTGTVWESLAKPQFDAFSALMGSTAAVFQKLVASSGDLPRSLDGWSFAVDRTVQTQEQQNQLIIDIANSMGAVLAPELVKLKKEGESLADTAVRLNDEFTLTNTLAQLLGKDVSTAFGAIGLASAAMRDKLVTAMGGMQSMSSAVQAYYQAYYTDAERLANDTKTLHAQFTALGLSVPASKDAFRGLIEAQDLSTTAGQALFAALMQIAPSFAQVADAAAKAVSPIATLADQIASVQKTAADAIDAQISASQTAAQNARQLADAYRQTSASLADSIRQLRGGDLSPLLPGQKLAEARAQLDKVYGQAATGDATALAALPQTATDFLTVSRAYNASSEAYTADFNRVMQLLDQANVASNAMASWQDYQSSLLQTQTGVLQQVKDELAKPNPDAAVLAEQASLLSTIAGLLREQTVQIVAGNGILTDQNGNIVAGNVLVHDQTGQIIGSNFLLNNQTGQIVLGNSLLGNQVGQLAAANAGQAVIQTLLNGQTVQVVDGNLILKDQSGLLSSSNSILQDQAGKITLGNSLVGAQTGQIISGNATQDVIKNITALDSSYSEQMLKALVGGATTQSDSLANILSGTDLTVSLLRQIVDLTAQRAQETQAGADVAAQAAADAAIREAAVNAASAAARAEQQQRITQATMVYDLVKMVSDQLRNNWLSLIQGFGGGQAQAENIASGTAMDVQWSGGSGQDFEASVAMRSAYYNAFAQAQAAYAAIPGHALGLAYVPHDNYLMRAHEGEAVIDAGTMAALRSYGVPVGTGAGGGASKDDIDSLRKELAASIAKTNEILQRMAETQSRDGEEQTARIETVVENSAQTIGRTVARAAEAGVKA